jgi:two-component system sensor histidine kinase YesM
MTPTASIIEDIKPILLNQSIVFIMFLVMIILASIYIVNSITLPVRNLIGQLNNIVIEQTMVQNIHKASSEIKVIVKYINKMLKRNKEIIEEKNNAQNELYNAQIHEKQAKLSFYESQINPHFLYNTLECIRSIADYYDIQKISEISLSTSNIFRYSGEADLPVESKYRYYTKITLSVPID